MVPTARSPREGASPQMQHVRPRHNWPKESHPSTSVTWTPKLKQMKNRAKLTQRHPRKNLPWGGTARDDLNNDVVLDYNSSDDNDAVTADRRFSNFQADCFHCCLLLMTRQCVLLNYCCLLLLLYFVGFLSVLTGCFNRFIMSSWWLSTQPWYMGIRGKNVGGDLREISNFWDLNLWGELKFKGGLRNLSVLHHWNLFSRHFDTHDI